MLTTRNCWRSSHAPRLRRSTSCTATPSLLPASCPLAALLHVRRAKLLREKTRMDELALTCERIARYNSRLKKVAILSEYLAKLGDADLGRAVRFLCCGPIQSEDRKFSVGGATLRDAALLATGIAPETWSICYRDVGDSGETISLLLFGKTANEQLTLAEAE